MADITEKLNEEWTRNIQADAVFEFRAEAQRFYWELCETLDKLNEIKSRSSFNLVDPAIKQEGQDFLDKLNALKNAIDAQHLDLVNWVQP